MTVQHYPRPDWVGTEASLIAYIAAQALLTPPVILTYRANPHMANVFYVYMRHDPAADSPEPEPSISPLERWADAHVDVDIDVEA